MQPFFNSSSYGWPGLASLYICNDKMTKLCFGPLTWAKVWSLWSTAGKDALWESEESIHRACSLGTSQRCDAAHWPSEASISCMSANSWVIFWGGVTVFSLILPEASLCYKATAQCPRRVACSVISDPDSPRSRAWPEHIGSSYSCFSSRSGSKVREHWNPPRSCSVTDLGTYGVDVYWKLRSISRSLTLDTGKRLCVLDRALLC